MYWLCNFSLKSKEKYWLSFEWPKWRFLKPLVLQIQTESTKQTAQNVFFLGQLKEVQRLRTDHVSAKWNDASVGHYLVNLYKVVINMNIVNKIRAWSIQNKNTVFYCSIRFWKELSFAVDLPFKLKKRWFWLKIRFNSNFSFNRLN